MTTKAKTKLEQARPSLAKALNDIEAKLAVLTLRVDDLNATSNARADGLDVLANRLDQQRDINIDTHRRLVELTCKVGEIQKDGITGKDWGTLAKEIGWIRGVIAEELGKKSPHAIWPEQTVTIEKGLVKALEETSAEDIYRRACEAALPAHIKEIRLRIKGLTNNEVEHRVANMIERDDPRMTDLTGLMYVREYIERNPTVAFTERFAKWLKANKFLILRFGHKLHEKV